MHAPRAVHACTFFNVNVDADVNNLRRVSIAELVNVIVSVNVDFSRSLVIVNVIVFVHAFAWPHGSPIASNISLT